MKIFDLQKFLAGEPITTIGGHKVVDFKYDNSNGDLFPLKVILKRNGLTTQWQYNEIGHPLGSLDPLFILCMAGPECWINVFYDKDRDMPWLGVNRYKTKEEAEEHLTDHKWYQTSIKINL
jgi:hypothetical protein